MESKPIHSRLPDQSLIASSTGTDQGDSPDKKVATRDKNSLWAFIYLTKGGTVTIDMAKLNSQRVRARWYDPRNGTYSNIGLFSDVGTREFTAPTSGENNDWVLILERN
jgi:hypothetical protein